MKPFISAVLLCLSLFAGTPEERMVPVEHIFAPSGFDANDNVEIVVTGFLPNLCHKSPSSKVKVEGGKIQVEVTSLYYSENNPFCSEMAVPFMETISLGLLSEGSYDIAVNADSQYKKTQKISIGRAQGEIKDTHTYAYVDYVEKTMGSETVRLRGYHYSDCFELDRIEYFSNGKDTYSILPILKKVSRFCPKKMIPFSYEFAVPEDLPAEKVLLHVRTLNGKSVNSVFDNTETPVPEVSF